MPKEYTIVARGNHRPGRCILTGRQDEPLIDTGVVLNNVQPYGHVYISAREFAIIAYQLGFASPAQRQALDDQITVLQAAAGDHASIIEDFKDDIGLAYARASDRLTADYGDILVPPAEAVSDAPIGLGEIPADDGEPSAFALFSAGDDDESLGLGRSVELSTDPNNDDTGDAGDK